MELENKMDPSKILSILGNDKFVKQRAKKSKLLDKPLEKHAAKRVNTFNLLYKVALFSNNFILRLKEQLGLRKLEKI